MKKETLLLIVTLFGIDVYSQIFIITNQCGQTASYKLIKQFDSDNKEKAEEVITSGIFAVGDSLAIFTEKKELEEIAKYKTIQADHNSYIIFSVGEDKNYNIKLFERKLIFSEYKEAQRRIFLLELNLSHEDARYLGNPICSHLNLRRYASCDKFK
jgi:hypothetical protein